MGQLSIKTVVILSLSLLVGCKTVSNNSQVLDSNKTLIASEKRTLKFDPKAIQKAEIDGEPVAISKSGDMVKYLEMYNESVEFLYNNPEVKLSIEERERRTYNQTKKVEFSELKELIKEISTPYNDFNVANLKESYKTLRESQAAKLSNLQAYYFHSISWKELKKEMDKLIKSYTNNLEKGYELKNKEIEKINETKAPNEQIPLKKAYLIGLDDNDIYLKLTSTKLEENLNYAIFAELAGKIYNIQRENKRNVYSEVKAYQENDNSSRHYVKSIEDAMLKQTALSQDPDDTFKTYFTFLVGEINPDKIKWFDERFQRTAKIYLLLKASRAMFFRRAARAYVYYTYYDALPAVR